MHLNERTRPIGAHGECCHVLRAILSLLPASPSPMEAAAASAPSAATPSHCSFMSQPKGLTARRRISFATIGLISGLLISGCDTPPRADQFLATVLAPLVTTRSDRAVVLIGGINDNTQRVFEPWHGQLQKSGAAIYKFTADHRSQQMSASAVQLANALERLRAEGVTDVTIHAHSMGGLVAKRSLHLLETQGLLLRFTRVRLAAYGTPWGGFWWGDLARSIPGSWVIVWALRMPMTYEIGSTSEFMQSLRKALPVNVSFIVVESADDLVARPSDSASKSQYAAILAQATTVRRLTNVRHFDYMKELLQPVL
jgi:hypothetical protein